MKKNIVSVDEFYLKAQVEKNVCPLNWLAEYYKEFPGKLVMIDDGLLSFLLNDSHCDKVEVSKHDGYQQKASIIWNATKNYPETRTVISSYGKDKITKRGRKYVVNSEKNYFVIEELHAEDIVAEDNYGENIKTDRQIILLQCAKEKTVDLM